MKFVKGMVVGTLVSAGIAMMYAGTMTNTRNKMIKKGRQFVRKMGMM